MSVPVTRSVAASERERSQSDTTRGRVTSSSSSSQPSDFENSHLLIITSRHGVTWNVFDDMTRISGLIPYNLDDLFTQLNFSIRDHSAGVKCSKNPGCCYHPIVWVKSLFEQANIYRNFTLSYSADIRIEAFMQVLAPFMTSLDNRPDGAVLRKIQDWNLPIFLLEVHSSPYKNSVSHTASNLLDQLRLLRCFNNTITKCVGFTFPKFATDRSQNRTCVTKVTVSFTDFMFIVDLAPLKIGEVRREIMSVVESAMGLQLRSDPVCCFMRLSPPEVTNIAQNFVDQGELTQVETRHSILLKNNDTFWKYIPSSKEHRELTFLNGKLKDCNPTYITLFSQVVYHERMEFLKFPAQLPPLCDSEAKQCLHDLMTKTATALEELHRLGFAHLDVRLPNICFALSDRDCIVKMIDLDRAKKNDDAQVGGYHGEMYVVGPHWSASQCDWKQLGLLASKVIFDRNHDEIVKDSRVDRDECLKKLIREGIWDEGACDASTNVQTHQRVSLMEILQRRPQSH